MCWKMSILSGSELAHNLSSLSVFPSSYSYNKDRGLTAQIFFKTTFKGKVVRSDDSPKMTQMLELSMKASILNIRRHKMKICFPGRDMGFLKRNYKIENSSLRFLELICGSKNPYFLSKILTAFLPWQYGNCSLL